MLVDNLVKNVNGKYLHTDYKMLGLINELTNKTAWKWVELEADFPFRSLLEITFETVGGQYSPNIQIISIMTSWLTPSSEDIVKLIDTRQSNKIIDQLIVAYDSNSTQVEENTKIKIFAHMYFGRSYGENQGAPRVYIETFKRHHIQCRAIKLINISDIELFKIRKVIPV